MRAFRARGGRLGGRPRRFVQPLGDGEVFEERDIVDCAELTFGELCEVRVYAENVE